MRVSRAKKAWCSAATRLSVAAAFESAASMLKNTWKNWLSRAAQTAGSPNASGALL